MLVFKEATHIFTLFISEASGVTRTYQPMSHTIWIHTWKTAAGGPRYFLLRPAAFLSVAVQPSAFAFQLLLRSLLLETWGIREKIKEYEFHENRTIITTEIARVQTRYSKCFPIQKNPLHPLKQYFEVVRENIIFWIGDIYTVQEIIAIKKNLQ